MHVRVVGLCLLFATRIGTASAQEPTSGTAIPPATRSGEVDPSPTTFTYKTVKDCPILVDVYRPAGDEVCPSILWIHGGALIFGNRKSVKQHQLRRYLDAGFVVASIDHRLAPETKLPEILEDLKDAYRWLREKGPELRLDPDRIAVVGDSAGAYLTLMAGFRLAPRPRALVSFYGYGDITGPWTTKPDPHYLQMDPVEKESAYGAVGGSVLSGSPIFPRVTFYNYCRQNGLWSREVVGLDPVEDREKLEAYCPARHVDASYPPTLLLHGDKDSDVPFEESVRMAEVLERNKVPHQLVAMKNYEHLFDVFPEGWPSQEPPKPLTDRKVIEAFDVVIAFLTSHLRG
jgi:acetyl esterase/lipase